MTTITAADLFCGAGGSSTVRLPELPETQARFSVLQRWTGRVQGVRAHAFTAVLIDTLRADYPDELMEFPLDEVSRSDKPLVQEGATFYWTIGYHDTASGQRDRVSTLRFARYPRLSSREVMTAEKAAARLADLLERD